MPDLLIWECWYRIWMLKEFNKYLAIYKHYLESHQGNAASESPTDKNIAEAREKINLMIPSVSKFLKDSGSSATIVYQEPKLVGGNVWSNIDLIPNIFTLKNMGVSLQLVIDPIQRSIGYYQSDLIASSLRTINPFWWLWKLTIAIVRVPFEIIGWAGYDSEKVEKSSGGKIYKAVAGLLAFIVALASFIASIIQVLESQIGKSLIQQIMK